MNKEERIKLVFETISKIVGFEIKPYKEFYMTGNGYKEEYKISDKLNLYYKTPDGYFQPSEYNILPIFKGGYQLEEIKEPLTTEEERDFLRHFKFDELAISTLLFLCMYDKKSTFGTAIDLNKINLGFRGLKKGKRYSREELGL